jgi:hypothetical protein
VPVGHALANGGLLSLDRLLDEDLIGIDPATPIMKDLRQAARQIRRASRA